MNALIARRIAVFIVAAMPFVNAELPVATSAQTLSVGPDGDTSLMWKGSDSSIALWRLDPTVGTVLVAKSYGPYFGYTPLSVTTGVSSYSYVLWKYSDESIVIWTLDPAMNFVSSENFGPFFGWTAQELSANPTSDSQRLLWRSTGGAAALWFIDNYGGAMFASIYGPYFGYDPDATSRSAINPFVKGRQTPSHVFYARGKDPRAAAAEAMAVHRTTEHQRHQ